jgi:hypothetical protein
MTIAIRFDARGRIFVDELKTGDDLTVAFERCRAAFARIGADLLEAIRRAFARFDVAVAAWDVRRIVEAIGRARSSMPPLHLRAERPVAAHRRLEEASIGPLALRSWPSSVRAFSRR